jgi:Recombination, repair and ssDNA binding protein UvsY
VLLEHYLTEWTKDAKFDLTELDTAAQNVPILHAKWWRYFSAERLKYRKLEIESKLLHRQKWEWYMGKLDDDERKTLGWPPQSLRITPASVPMYMEADPDIQKRMTQKAGLEETLRFLEDVIKSINSRSFQISNALNWAKFKMGV